MRRKTRKIRCKKERSIISDSLPYEVPITFTNRHFYEFLRKNKIEINNESTLIWQEGVGALTDALHIIFSLPIDSAAAPISDNGVCKLTVGASNLKPFSYLINHKGDQFRELSIPHPRCQLEFVNFYNEYKELILYYASLSSFSIRKPVRIASSVFYKDKKHRGGLSADSQGVEEASDEYESLRSFFVYEDYSNVYKFYESSKFHRCEKKYNKLKRLDISDCFNSIYSHSISWAIIGKDKVKENIGPSKLTFSGKFDALMQASNSNETNGILIGPEYSRIFAELILQSIDKQLEENLFLRFDLYHKVDYEIFRYVDDYFVFFNDDEDCAVIESCLQRFLQVFKLRLNISKSKLYEKPIITEISRAKLRVVGLLKEKIDYKITLNANEDDANAEEIATGSIYVNSNHLITDFKTILRECDVAYKDMLNFTLAILEGRLDSIFESFQLVLPDNRSNNAMTRALLALVEFSFFISSVSPRVNTTIRLCRIIRAMIVFLNRAEFEIENRNAICKSVYDNACFILNKYKTSEHTQVETLYLLIAISELGKVYRIEQDVLARYFNIQRSKKTGKYVMKQDLNYFSFTVLMFYMRDKKRYLDLRTFIEKEIVEYLKAISGGKYSFTECVMIGLDLVSCPYAALETKHIILEQIFKITDASRRAALIDLKDHNGRPQLWFTTWTKFDFGRELDAKQSMEVY